MCVRECIIGINPLPCGYISRVALAEHAVRFQSAAGLIQYICVYIKPVFIVSIVSLGKALDLQVKLKVHTVRSSSTGHYTGTVHKESRILYYLLHPAARYFEFSFL